MWSYMWARVKREGPLRVIAYYCNPKRFSSYAQWRFDQMAEKKVFTPGKGAAKKKTRVRFFLLLYGDFYIDLFTSYCMPSLLQDGNIPALVREGYELEFCCYTKSSEYEHLLVRCESTFSRVSEYASVNVIPLDGFDDHQGHNEIILKAMIDHVERCIEADALMFPIGPDEIFGNRSIYNGVRLVEGKDICLAMGNARLSYEKVSQSRVFEPLTRYEATIENDELVDITFAHGHSSLYGSLDDQDKNHTPYGVSIRHLHDNVYSVVYNIPSVKVATLHQEDLDYFKNIKTFNLFDREWPTRLVKKNRIKLAASSDLFFVAEVTPDSIGSKLRENCLNNDQPKDMHLSHYVFNSVYCTWIGKKNRADPAGGSQPADRTV